MHSRWIPVVMLQGSCSCPQLRSKLKRPWKGSTEGSYVRLVAWHYDIPIASRRVIVSMPARPSGRATDEAGWRLHYFCSVCVQSEWCVFVLNSHCWLVRHASHCRVLAGTLSAITYLQMTATDHRYYIRHLYLFTASLEIVQKRY